MNRIFLIACSKSKFSKKAAAKDLYTGTLFKKCYEYSLKHDPDAVYIFSGKHYLLDLDTEIEPYDEYLCNKSGAEIKDWARVVLQELKLRTDIANDHFTILASKCYRKYLVSELRLVEIPLAGMRIGEQLQFLTEKLK